MFFCRVVVEMFHFFKHYSHSWLLSLAMAKMPSATLLLTSLD
jgi:hypothetical protein